MRLSRRVKQAADQEADRGGAKADHHHLQPFPPPVAHQAGQLTILASGPDWLQPVLAPVFAALGRATVWLGPAGNGTKAKLVLNNWLADPAETTAESLAFAGQLGLDADVIVDLLEANPLGAP